MNTKGSTGFLYFYTRLFVYDLNMGCQLLNPVVYIGRGKTRICGGHSALPPRTADST